MAPTFAFCAIACRLTLRPSRAQRAVCAPRAPFTPPPPRFASLRRTSPRCDATGNATAPRARIGAVSILLLANAATWAILVSPLMAAVAAVGAVLRRDVRGAQQSLVRLWLRVVLLCSLVRIRITRRTPPPKRALYIANHQSALDLWIACASLPRAALLAPDRAFRVPLLGWMLSRAGWICVTGTGRRARVGALSAAAAVLVDSPVIIFPEGTPAVDGVLRRFPSAVFKAAQTANVPICPLTIDGSVDMHDGGPVPCRRSPQPIQLTFHDPIDAAGRDAKDVASEAHAAIRSALPAHLRGEEAQ